MKKTKEMEKKVEEGAPIEAIEKPRVFDTDNHLTVVVSDTTSKNQYISQECCTCINVLLTNDGEIATSFLGVHSDDIISILERAQKLYFRKLKKKFREDKKKIQKESKRYSRIKVKDKALDTTFDINNNDYDSVEPKSADAIIGNKEKDTEG
jgi:hypothetical protein